MSTAKQLALKFGRFCFIGYVPGKNEKDDKFIADSVRWFLRFQKKEFILRSAILPEGMTVDDLREFNSTFRCYRRLHQVLEHLLVICEGR